MDLVCIAPPPNTRQHYKPSKMSAIQMIITNLQSLNEVDRAHVLGHFNKNTSLSSNAPAKDVGMSKDVEKKENANKGKPTCYADFAKKVMDEQKDAIAAFKLANPELKGAHLSFAGTYKKEHPEVFAAFEVTWKLAHPKATEPVAEKPKRVMTEEQKAKMKAGREAAKVEKAATQVAVSMGVELMGNSEVPESAPDVAPVAELKKRGPKKLDAMTPEQRAKHDIKKAERQAKKASGNAMDKVTRRPTVDTDTGSEVSATSVPSGRSASPKQKAE